MVPPCARQPVLTQLNLGLEPGAVLGAWSAPAARANPRWCGRPAGNTPAVFMCDHDAEHAEDVFDSPDALRDALLRDAIGISIWGMRERRIALARTALYRPNRGGARRTRHRLRRAGSRPRAAVPAQSLHCASP